jgi:uncharacterized protein YbjT (DUF2867 family)
MPDAVHRVLVTGATGFIGRALRPALLARGLEVRATTRRLGRAPRDGREEWVEADLLRPETLTPALEGVDVAYYLVHSMGDRSEDYREREHRSAEAFATAAARARLKRIVYLGGVAPGGTPSPHLASRLAVGDILRSGQVPTVELRASMIIGPGSTSWRICRDLSLRLPAMVLPSWLHSRTCPIALEDVVRALVDALEVPLAQGEWFDLPGPEVLSGREILERIAALRGVRPLMVQLPVLTPRLSSLWLKLVTSADYAVARELVAGLTQDLLPRDARYFALTHHPPRISFDEAARRTLAAEEADTTRQHGFAAREERWVARLGLHLKKRPAEG